MKYLLLSMFLLPSLFCNAQNIKWKTFSEAQKEQGDNPKEILLLVGIGTGGFSLGMYLDIVKKDKVLKDFIDENYIFAFLPYNSGEEINYKGKIYHNSNLNKRGKCNKETCTHDFVKDILSFEISPSFYVVGASGKITEPISGMKTSVELLEILKSFKEYDE